MELSGNSPSGTTVVRLKNYYDVLQVEPSVTRVQIREAFLRLKKTYSTGSQALYSIMDEEEARLSLAEIEEAFRVLDDDHQRRDYDARLRASGVLRDQRPHAAHFNSDEEGLWSQGEDGQGTAADNGEAIVPAIAKRNPSLHKVSPRLAEPGVREKLQELIDGGDLADGTFYKRVRLAADIDIKDLYAQIKIIPEYLKALENNDYARLPPLVYVKGFLKSYLQFIGIQDTQAAITAFAERWQEWEVQNKA